MTHTFIGDLHLGKRLPHSTVKSNERFQEFLKSTISVALETAGGGQVVQLGDLFDSHTSNHLTFLDAYQVARCCDKVLRGNHDFNHDLTKDPALASLTKLLNENSVINGVHEYEDITYVGFAPTQEIFEEILNGLEPNKVLCLHVNSPNHVPGPTENTLTQELYQSISDRFDYIISGHEHNTSQIGNLVMTGSLLPFSFGEMEDKFIWHYDAGKLSKRKVWQAEDNFLNVSAPEFLELGQDHGYQFIEIVGEISNSMWMDVNNHMAYLFKESEVFAIKNSGELDKEISGSLSIDDQEVTTWQQLANKRVEELLGDEGLVALEVIN